MGKFLLAVFAALLFMSFGISAKGRRKKLKQTSRLALGIFIFVVWYILALGAGLTYLMQIPYLLAAGWAYYIQRVLPQVQLNFELLIFFLIGLFVLLFGSHRFLCFLRAEANSPSDENTTESEWKFRWTLSGLLLFLAMFASGIAFVGAVHQTAWMFNSPEPLIGAQSFSFESVETVPRPSPRP